MKPALFMVTTLFAATLSLAAMAQDGYTEYDATAADTVAPEPTADALVDRDAELNSWAYDNRGLFSDFKKDWQVSVALGGGFLPAYRGSDDYEAKLLPMVDARWRDKIEINNRDGLGYNLLTGKDGRLGIGLGYNRGRDESDGDDDHLRGMGDIDATIEGRLYASYSYENLTFDGEMRHDLAGSHEGWTAEAGITYGIQVDDKLRVGIRPSVTYASDNYTQSFFGVTSLQSSRSGLAAYDAAAGLRDIAITGNAVYSFNENWFFNSFAGYERLMGDAADSPVTQSANQFKGGLGVGYRF